MSFLEQDQAGFLRLHVKVVPGARQNRVVGLLGDRLKVQVAAPPEDGRANAAVALVLAEVLGVDRARVELVSGASSPRKTFRISGIDEGAARAALAAREP